jgi:hypothetical protein
MGKKIRFREARMRAADEAVAARLRTHSQTETEPKPVETYSDLDHICSASIEKYRGFALRRPERWRCRIRSRATERRFMDLVKFTFDRYPVAPHLENAWIEDLRTRLARSRQRTVQHDRAQEGPDFCRWYIIVTQGGSLYRQAASGIMSRLETHHFLNAPEAISSPRHACWYAFARTHTAHASVAMRIAQSRLTTFSMTSAFWKDVARLFARNPMKITDMNDLIDFLRAEADGSFSLQGRSVESLQRRMLAWHRMLRLHAPGARGGQWAGHPLPDVEYQTGGEENRALWRFKQIKTGHDLFREGERMHHCVVTYKSFCMRGDISIWSLTCEYPLGNINRGVTLEVRNDGTIVQCRGFGNRLPYPNELSVVKRWANDHGLEWRAIER